MKNSTDNALTPAAPGTTEILKALGKPLKEKVIPIPDSNISMHLGIWKMGKSGFIIIPKSPVTHNYDTNMMKIITGDEIALIKEITPDW